MKSVHRLDSTEHPSVLQFRILPSQTDTYGNKVDR